MTTPHTPSPTPPSPVDLGVVIGSIRSALRNSDWDRAAKNLTLLDRVPVAARKAAIDLPDQGGRPLIVLAAAQNAPIAIGNKIIELGADPRGKQNSPTMRGHGRESYHYSAERGAHEWIQLLTPFVKDPDVRDNRGCTALRLAVTAAASAAQPARKELLTTITLLRSQGADPSAKDKSDLSPVAVALSRHDNEVVALLGATEARAVVELTPRLLNLSPGLAGVAVEAALSECKTDSERAALGKSLLNGSHNGKGLLNHLLSDPVVAIKNLRILLRSGTDLNHPGENGILPFDAVLRTNNLQLLEAAISLGMDPTLMHGNGDSILYRYLTAARTGPSSAIVELLYPLQQDREAGPRSFTQAIEARNWARALDLLTCLNPLVKLPSAQVCEGLYQYCSGVARDERKLAIAFVFDLLDDYERRWKTRSEVAHDLFSLDRKPPFVSLLVDDGMSALSVSLVWRALDLGADPSSSWKDGGVTASLLRAVEHSHEALAVVLRAGADPNQQDENGRTPLLRLLDDIRDGDSEDSAEILQTLTLLLRSGANPDHRDLKGDGALTIALRTPGGVRRAAEIGSTLTRYQSKETSAIIEVQSAGGRTKLTIQQLLSELSRFVESHPESSSGLAQLFDEHGDLSQLYHYTQAHQEIKSGSIGFEAGALTQLLPGLVFASDRTGIDLLFEAHPRPSSALNDLRASSKLEPELMALFNSSAQRELTEGAYRPLLKTIEGLFQSGDIIGRSSVRINNLARAGALTFGFPLWRFDAQRTGETAAKKSMLEQFGFKRIEGRESDRVYGPGQIIEPAKLKLNYQLPKAGGGYEVREFDKHTLIEFRHAYLMASNPAWGTIFIRNSSPHFGRDLLPHPAYYAANGVGVAMLETINEAWMESTALHLLSPRLYLDDAVDAKIDRLLGELSGLRSVYARWKFNTDPEAAWDTDPDTGKSALVGGHFSPGFEALVSTIEQVKGSAALRGKALALGFVHLDLPPWQFFTFPRKDETVADRLPLTEETIETLRRLAQSTASDQELDDSGLRSFFQKAGFETGGELVITTI